MKEREPNKVDKHIGSRIRMRRIELKISQSVLGDELGVSFQQVQKYEKGVNRVGGGRLQSIAVALDCPISYFYENAPGKAGDGDTSEMTAFMTSANGSAIAKAFESLPENSPIRRQVRDLIVTIASSQPTKGQRRAA